MDLFGIKAKKEAEILRHRIEFQAVTISELRKTIREMDVKIYQMGQETSWPRQRPFFEILLAGTEQRRKQESDRVSGIVIKELSST